MINPTRAILFSLAALAASCTTTSKAPSPPPTPPTASESPVISESHRSPLVLKVDGPEQVAPGATIEVKIVMKRSVEPLPMHLTVTVPPGVEVLKGAVAEDIDEAGKKIERTLTIKIGDAVPADDLVVRASSEGEGWGVHASGAYRFGRPEPKLHQPQRSGPPLIVHGRNLGRGIPIGAVRPDAGAGSGK